MKIEKKNKPNSSRRNQLGFLPFMGRGKNGFFNPRHLFLLMSLSAFCSPAAFGQEQTGEITLGQALRLAEKKSPTLRASVSREREAGELDRKSVV